MTEIYFVDILTDQNKFPATCFNTDPHFLNVHNLVRFAHV